MASKIELYTEVRPEGNFDHKGDCVSIRLMPFIMGSGNMPDIEIMRNGQTVYIKYNELLSAIDSFLAIKGVLQGLNILP